MQAEEQHRSICSDWKCGTYVAPLPASNGYFFLASVSGRLQDVTLRTSLSFPLTFACIVLFQRERESKEEEEEEVEDGGGGRETEEEEEEEEEDKNYNKQNKKSPSPHNTSFEMSSRSSTSSTRNSINCCFLSLRVVRVAAATATTAVKTGAPEVVAAVILLAVATVVKTQYS